MKLGRVGGWACCTGCKQVLDAPFQIPRNDSRRPQVPCKLERWESQGARVKKKTEVLNLLAPLPAAKSFSLHTSLDPSCTRSSGSWFHGFKRFGELHVNSIRSCARFPPQLFQRLRSQQQPKRPNSCVSAAREARSTAEYTSPNLP